MARRKRVQYALSAHCRGRARCSWIGRELPFQVCHNARPVPLWHSNGFQWGQAVRAILRFAVSPRHCKRRDGDCKPHDKHAPDCLSGWVAI